MLKIIKFCATGPGGLNCPCCGPSRGNRKEFFRSAKRKEHLEAIKYENLALDLNLNKF